MTESYGIAQGLSTPLMPSFAMAPSPALALEYSDDYPSPRIAPTAKLKDPIDTHVPLVMALDGSQIKEAPGYSTASTSWESQSTNPMSQSLQEEVKNGVLFPKSQEVGLIGNNEHAEGATMETMFHEEIIDLSVKAGKEEYGPQECKKTKMDWTTGGKMSNLTDNPILSTLNGIMTKTKPAQQITVDKISDLKSGIRTLMGNNKDGPIFFGLNNELQTGSNYMGSSPSPSTSAEGKGKGKMVEGPEKNSTNDRYMSGPDWKERNKVSNLTEAEGLDKDFFAVKHKSWEGIVLNRALNKKKTRTELEGRASRMELRAFQNSMQPELQDTPVVEREECADAGPSEHYLMWPRNGKMGRVKYGNLNLLFAGLEDGPRWQPKRNQLSSSTTVPHKLVLRNNSGEERVFPLGHIGALFKSLEDKNTWLNAPLHIENGLNAMRTDGAHPQIRDESSGVSTAPLESLHKPEPSHVNIQGTTANCLRPTGEDVLETYNMGVSILEEGMVAQGMEEMGIVDVNTSTLLEEKDIGHNHTPSPEGYLRLVGQDEPEGDVFSRVSTRLRGPIYMLGGIRNAVQTVIPVDKECPPLTELQKFEDQNTGREQELDLQKPLTTKDLHAISQGEGKVGLVTVGFGRAPITLDQFGLYNRLMSNTHAEKLPTGEWLVKISNSHLPQHENCRKTFLPPELGIDAILVDLALDDPTKLIRPGEPFKFKIDPCTAKSMASWGLVKKMAPYKAHIINGGHLDPLEKIAATLLEKQDGDVHFATASDIINGFAVKEDECDCEKKIVWTGTHESRLDYLGNIPLSIYAGRKQQGAHCIMLGLTMVVKDLYPHDKHNSFHSEDKSKNLLLLGQDFIEHKQHYKYILSDWGPDLSFDYDFLQYRKNMVLLRDGKFTVHVDGFTRDGAAWASIYHNPGSWYNGTIMLSHAKGTDDVIGPTLMAIWKALMQILDPSFKSGLPMEQVKGIVIITMKPDIAQAFENDMALIKKWQAKDWQIKGKTMGTRELWERLIHAMWVTKDLLGVPVEVRYESEGPGLQCLGILKATIPPFISLNREGLFKSNYVKPLGSKETSKISPGKLDQQHLLTTGICSQESQCNVSIPRAAQKFLHNLQSEGCSKCGSHHKVYPPPLDHAGFAGPVVTDDDACPLLQRLPHVFIGDWMFSKEFGAQELLMHPSQCQSACPSKNTIPEKPTRSKDLPQQFGYGLCLCSISSTMTVFLKQLGDKYVLVYGNSTWLAMEKRGLTLQLALADEVGLQGGLSGFDDWVRYVKEKPFGEDTYVQFKEAMFKEVKKEEKRAKRNKRSKKRINESGGFSNMMSSDGKVKEQTDERDMRSGDRGSTRSKRKGKETARQYPLGPESLCSQNIHGTTKRELQVFTSQISALPLSLGQRTISASIVDEQAEKLAMPSQQKAHARAPRDRGRQKQQLSQEEKISTNEVVSQGEVPDKFCAAKYRLNEAPLRAELAKKSVYVMANEDTVDYKHDSVLDYGGEKVQKIEEGMVTVCRIGEDTRHIQDIKGKLQTEQAENTEELKELDNKNVIRTIPNKLPKEEAGLFTPIIRFEMLIHGDNGVKDLLNGQQSELENVNKEDFLGDGHHATTPFPTHNKSTTNCQAESVEVRNLFTHKVDNVQQQSHPVELPLVPEAASRKLESDVISASRVTIPPTPNLYTGTSEVSHAAGQTISWSDLMDSDEEEKAMDAFLRGIIAWDDEFRLKNGLPPTDKNAFPNSGKVNTKIPQSTPVTTLFLGRNRGRPRALTSKPCAHDSGSKKPSASVKTNREKDLISPNNEVKIPPVTASQVEIEEEARKLNSSSGTPPTDRLKKPWRTLGKGTVSPSTPPSPGWISVTAKLPSKSDRLPSSKELTNPGRDHRGREFIGGDRAKVKSNELPVLSAPSFATSTSADLAENIWERRKRGILESIRRERGKLKGGCGTSTVDKLGAESKPAAVGNTTLSVWASPSVQKLKQAFRSVGNSRVSPAR